LGESSCTSQVPWAPSRNVMALALALALALEAASEVPRAASSEAAATESAAEAVAESALALWCIDHAPLYSSAKHCFHPLPLRTSRASASAFAPMGTAHPVSTRALGAWRLAHGTQLASVEAPPIKVAHCVFPTNTSSSCQRTHARTPARTHSRTPARTHARTHARTFALQRHANVLYTRLQRTALICASVSCQTETLWMGESPMCATMRSQIVATSASR
jgi:hypothetical protein